MSRKENDGFNEQWDEDMKTRGVEKKCGIHGALL